MIAMTAMESFFVNQAYVVTGENLPDKMIFSPLAFRNLGVNYELHCATTELVASAAGVPDVRLYRVAAIIIARSVGEQTSNVQKYVVIDFNDLIVASTISPLIRFLYFLGQAVVIIPAVKNDL